MKSKLMLNLVSAVSMIASSSTFAGDTCKVLVTGEHQPATRRLAVRLGYEPVERRAEADAELFHRHSGPLHDLVLANLRSGVVVFQTPSRAFFWRKKDVLNWARQEMMNCAEFKKL